MKTFLALARGETLRFATELRRYLIDSIAALAIMALILIVAQKGMDWAAGGAAPAATRGSFAASYLLWVFAFRAVQAIGLMVHDEMQKGTLEQLYLSPLGIEAVFVSRAALELVYTALLTAAIYALSLVFGSPSLILDLSLVPQALLALLLALPGVWGLGMALGALVLLAKKSASFLAFVSYGLIALAALPAYPFSAFSLLPYAGGASALRFLLAEGRPYPWSWLALVAGVSCFWLFAGALAWKAGERAARRGNLFGQY